MTVSSCGDEDATPTRLPSAPEEKFMDSLSARIAAAKEFQEKGNYAAALAVSDSLLAKYPGQLDALGIKSDVLKAQGKPLEALAVLEQAYALQPRDKETAYNLAYEYADAKDRKALSLTDTLVKYDKTETIARAWYIKGHFFNRHGDDANALRYFDSATIADYNFIDAHLDKGRLLYQQKDLEGALQSFATGQKVSPGTGEFYYWVAKTQEAMGNKADAKSNYERAYALDKELTDAKAAAERL